MAKRKVVLRLLILIALLFPKAAQGIKPRPPLQLALSSTLLSDGMTEITLSAKANTGTEGVRLSIELPLGLILIEGETAWEGPLNRGEKQTLVLIVQNEGVRTYTVIGTARVHLPNADHFTQEKPLVLNPPESMAPSPTPPIREKSGNNPVLEFRGN